MLAVAWLVLLSAAAPSHAQVEAPSRLTVTWENDLFAGTDRHYTNGLRIELAGRLDPRALPTWLRGDEAEWELSVGQRIYTPERLDEAALVADDRPYAGWSYLTLSVTRRAAALAWEDRIELSLGVVGPASGAQATHELAHDLFRSEAPRGWRHQLRDEPTVSLAYQASAELTRGEVGGLTYDVRPTLGISVGNVATFASLGAAARFGLGVPDATGAPPPPVRLYFTAAAEVRLVGYDVFLDGSLLRDGGQCVSRQRVVAGLTAGVTLAIHDRVSLTYTHTLRTTEFVGQVGRDQFGSISLAITW
ncbi:MAG: lipid A deacylase LpxR family protein [Planctomycetota bacterium]